MFSINKIFYQLGLLLPGGRFPGPDATVAFFRRAGLAILFASLVVATLVGLYYINLMIWNLVVWAQSWWAMLIGIPYGFVLVGWGWIVATVFDKLIYE